MNQYTYVNQLGIDTTVVCTPEKAKEFEEKYGIKLTLKK